jgi:hypothetical protein
MPAATPKAIVAKLNAALLEAMKDPDVVKRFETIGAEPVGSTPDEMAQHLARESERWTKLIQERHQARLIRPPRCGRAAAPAGGVVVRCACVPVHQAFDFLSVLSPIMKKRTLPTWPCRGRHPRAALGPRPSPCFPPSP